MRRSLLLAFGAAAAITAGAYATTGARGVASGAPARAEAPAHAAAAASDVRGPITTHGDIAMRNLEADLRVAERRVLENPADLAARLELSGLVYLRARVTGDIDEMARAIGETDECVRRHPDAAEAWLTRAVQKHTLHRFDEARADLARARALGADERRVANVDRELDWNAGLWGPVAERIREEALRAPSVSSIARLARLEHDLGRYDVADSLYGRALSLVDDTGPIPVAMLELQRGMNLSDAGRLREAEATFRSAAARLPRYVAAREHLAETLHRLGRDDEAIALYEEITKVSSDPEFIGALGGLYRARGRVVEADGLRARATKRYEELLQRYPEAMAWHAAEFFAGEGGDEARARALLEKNAALRPNPESLEALARLEQAAGATSRADDLTRRAATIRAAAQIPEPTDTKLSLRTPSEL